MLHNLSVLIIETEMMLKKEIDFENDLAKVKHDFDHRTVKDQTGPYCIA